MKRCSDFIEGTEWYNREWNGLDGGGSVDVEQFNLPQTRYFGESGQGSHESLSVTRNP